MVSREPSGRYQYDGNLDRLCVCGHTLGVHIHGGKECGSIPGKQIDLALEALRAHAPAPQEAMGGYDEEQHNRHINELATANLKICQLETEIVKLKVKLENG